MACIYARTPSPVKETYDLEEDPKGSKYVGMSLDRDYAKGEVHLSMPGYVAEAL